MPTSNPVRMTPATAEALEWVDKIIRGLAGEGWSIYDAHLEKNVAVTEVAFGDPVDQATEVTITVKMRTYK